MHTENSPFLIELCGNISSGKTTFAEFCSAYGVAVVGERYAANPFFEDFYKDQKSVCFETEIVFLLIHYNQVKQCLLNTARPAVCDFSITLDRAYADVTLDANRAKLFQDLADELEEEIGRPRLLVHLVCPENVLLDRIRNRGRIPELAITSEYLKCVSDSLQQRVDNISKFVPVLRIDSHEYDFTRGFEGHDFLPSLLNYLK